MLFLPAVGEELELSRAPRTWEFLSAVGRRAGLFGNESGNLEAWAYPLKILRNFHLRFLIDGRALPAETLARRVTVRPERATIAYTGDSFSIEETLFVPLDEPGAIIEFAVETTHPLEIEAAFERDFTLEWPAALGGTYISWDPTLHAFFFGEEQKKYAALVGSAGAALVSEEYQTSYSSTVESVFRLGATAKGRDTKVIALAASFDGRAAAESTYRHLLADYSLLLEKASQYYRDYLDRTVNLELPDESLRQSYDWARVSLIQGMVENPMLGRGLVAGYRTSGMSQRPGFAWFFGRDAFWSALALDAEADFESAREALDFVSRFERADGKIPHEISQAASLVPWFTAYPYAYASADATPLYIIAASDYVSQSGDTGFAREKWASLGKAYDFLRSTYDRQGLPQNFGIGHGWVEGGPLLPVKTELYQSSLGAETLLALSRLSKVVGESERSRELEENFANHKRLLNQAFWSEEGATYAFALDQSGQKVLEPSVLATVPMWFGLLDPEKAAAMISQLAGPDHQTDWGMRIISSRASRYDPAGYHFGSVWPLFTGWAAVGEYRNHRPLAAYVNLEANAQLALDGSLGHVTEVLSGDYYQPLSTSSPHQIWSAAMVISPLLRGLLGLEQDGLGHRVMLAPHLPAHWAWFTAHHVRVADAQLDLSFHRTLEELTLSIDATGEATLEFAPALAPRARVLGAELNGQRLPFHLETNDFDQHVAVLAPLKKGTNLVRIRVKDDFAIGLNPVLPPLGSRSRGLRVLGESWSPSRDSATWEFAGIEGAHYELELWNPGEIASVDGAKLAQRKLVLEMPASASDAYPRQKITVHFKERR